MQTRPGMNGMDSTHSYAQFQEQGNVVHVSVGAPASRKPAKYETMAQLVLGIAEYGMRAMVALIYMP